MGAAEPMDTECQLYTNTSFFFLKVTFDPVLQRWVISCWLRKPFIHWSVSKSLLLILHNKCSRDMTAIYMTSISGDYYYFCLYPHTRVHAFWRQCFCLAYKLKPGQCLTHYVNVLTLWQDDEWGTSWVSLRSFGEAGLWESCSSP